jgi:hypothetical protein
MSRNPYADVDLLQGGAVLTVVGRNNGSSTESISAIDTVRRSVEVAGFDSGPFVWQSLVGPLIDKSSLFTSGTKFVVIVHWLYKFV